MYPVVNSHFVRRTGIMTEQKQAELIGFMARGLTLSAEPKDRWAIILMGKFGHPGIALTNYDELEKRLPRSKPDCMRKLYIYGQLLETDWRELADIHHAAMPPTDDHEEYLAGFKKILDQLDEITWARDIMGDAMTQYETLADQAQLVSAS